MNGIIIEKLRKVKEGVFTEVLNKIEQIENISTKFHFTDLKIHNVAYYLWCKAQDALGLSDGQISSLFELLCEDEYGRFEEWEQENLNYVKRAYIGRTSSFYYQSDWYGDIIDNGILEELLEGKAVLKDSLGGLDANLYDYLLNIKKFDEIEFSFDDEEELYDFLENEVELLELLSDDLDTVLVIVNEAKLAYDYLADYKTQDCEYTLAKQYLEYELIEYRAKAKAEKLFDKVLGIIEPLNLVNNTEFSIKVINNEYILMIKHNNEHENNIDTGIKVSHELSNVFVECILNELNTLKDDSFDFE